jgi:hypothetical protein
MNHFEEQAALERMRLIFASGGSRYRNEADTVNPHPLTTNDSNGPLLTKPHVYKPLPKLPAIGNFKR